MIVISDTSPLLYLLLINHLDLLPQLYGQVIIPEIVRDELRDPGAPIELQQWIANPPEWLQIQSVTSTPNLSPVSGAYRVLQDKSTRKTLAYNLNPGEQAAINLAIECGADLLIIDERLGRRAASYLGIPIIGTLGILDEAALRGLLNLSEAIARLTATNFRVSAHLIHDLLNRHSQTP